MPVIITAERPDTPDATQLIDELQTHLSAIYPIKSQHGYSAQKLLAENIPFFVLRVDGTPAGCGGIRFVGKEFGELKRMYLRPQFRGSGLGKLLINHLEKFALENGINLVRLETGMQQTAAIKLYESEGFYRISPFPPYSNDPVSQCYEKSLSSPRT